MDAYTANASKTPVQGLSYFSTNGYQRLPRAAGHPPPLPIARSNPEQDKKEMIKDLRERFPAVCHGVFVSLDDTHTTWDIRTYFDEYDFYLQGGKFLYDVLMEIMKENEKNCLDFCLKWSRVHYNSIYALFEIHDPLILFHASDHDFWGYSFLKKAMDCMTLALKNTMEEETQREIQKHFHSLKRQRNKLHNEQNITVHPQRSRGGSGHNRAGPSMLRNSNEQAQRSYPSNQGLIVSHWSPIEPPPFPFSNGLPVVPFQMYSMSPFMEHMHGPPMPSAQVLQQRGFHIMNQNMEMAIGPYGVKYPRIPIDSFSQVPSSVRVSPTITHQQPSVLPIYQGYQIEEEKLPHTQPVDTGFRDSRKSTRHGKSKAKKGFSNGENRSLRRSSLSQQSNYGDTTILDRNRLSGYPTGIKQSYPRRDASNSSQDGQNRPGRAYYQSPPKTRLAHSPKATPQEMPMLQSSANTDGNNRCIVTDQESPMYVGPFKIGEGVTVVPQLWVSHDKALTPDDVKEALERYVPIESVSETRPNRTTEFESGFVFVTVFSVHDARLLLQQSVLDVDGNRLKIQVGSQYFTDPFRRRTHNKRGSQGRNRFPESGVTTPRRAEQQRVEQHRYSIEQISSMDNALQPRFSPQDARSDLQHAINPDSIAIAGVQRTGKHTASVCISTKDFAERRETLGSPQSSTPKHDRKINKQTSPKKRKSQIKEANMDLKLDSETKTQQCTAIKDIQTKPVSIVPRIPTWADVAASKIGHEKNAKSLSTNSTASQPEMSISYPVTTDKKQENAKVGEAVLTTIANDTDLQADTTVQEISTPGRITPEPNRASKPELLEIKDSDKTSSKSIDEDTSVPKHDTSKTELFANTKPEVLATNSNRFKRKQVKAETVAKQRPESLKFKANVSKLPVSKTLQVSNDKSEGLEANTNKEDNFEPENKSRSENGDPNKSPADQNAVPCDGKQELEKEQFIETKKNEEMSLIPLPAFIFSPEVSNGEGNRKSLEERQAIDPLQPSPCSSVSSSITIGRPSSSHSQRNNTEGPGLFVEASDQETVLAFSHSDGHRTPKSPFIDEFQWVREYETIKAIIPKAPEHLRKQWETKADNLKKTIQDLEIKLRNDETQSHSSSLTKGQKKTLNKRIKTTIAKHTAELDELFLLRGIVDRAVIIPVSGQNNRSSTQNQATRSARPSSRNHIDRKPEFFAPSSDADIPGRTIEEIREENMSKTVSGSYALKGAAMAYASENFSSLQPHALQEHSEQRGHTAGLTQNRRMSYAKVAANSIALENSEGGAPPGGVQPLTDRRMNTKVPLSEENKGHARDVSWGIGPGEEWGEEGLRGKGG